MAIDERIIDLRRRRKKELIELICLLTEGRNILDCSRCGNLDFDIEPPRRPEEHDEAFVNGGYICRKCRKETTPNKRGLRINNDNA